MVESLVRAGAFDPVNDHRASLLASVGIALESAEQASRAVNQVSLFGELEDAGARACRCVDVPRWSDRERLQNEKLAPGLLSLGPSVQELRAASCAASSRRGSTSSRRSPIRCCSRASSTACASR